MEEEEGGRLGQIQELHDPDNDDTKSSWYHTFHYIHLFSGMAFLAAGIVIAIFAGMGELHGQVYWTISALRENALPPPKLITDFEFFHTAHLYWVCLFIVFLPALYHLVLAAPAPIGQFFSEFFISDAMKERYFADDSPAHGGKIHELNPLMIMWFDHNLVFHSSPLKHIPYGMTMALFTTLVATLVGITDFILLANMWFLTVAGYMGLWKLEYDYGRQVRSLFPKNVSGKELLKTAKKLVFNWLPFWFALVLVVMPLATILAYFSIMLSEESSGVKWFVWIAVIYYFVDIIVLFASLFFYHMEVAVFHDYLYLESLLMIFRTVALIVVATTVSFGSMDEPFLYGIQT